jgi:Glycosyltransferase family 87
VPGRTAGVSIAGVRNRLLRDGYVVLAIVFVGLRLFDIDPWADSVDAYAYWTTRTGDFYAAAETGRIGAYLYSPAFAQALAPLVVLLPLSVFTALWTAINFAALWWLVGRLALPALLFLPISLEIISGNVHLLYAVAIVAGFRYPATWALMLLTKITPGVGLIWFGIRREWRSLAVALGVTAAIAAVSFLIDRTSWAQWIGVLRADLTGAGQASFSTVGWYLAVPLAPRLVVAAAIVAVAAWTHRRWLVPVAIVVSLPVVWLNGLAVLAAVVPLWKGRAVNQTPPVSATDRISSAPVPSQ